jgi:hypothetical protein
MLRARADAACRAWAEAPPLDPAAAGLLAGPSGADLEARLAREEVRRARQLGACAEARHDLELAVGAIEPWTPR